ncbi:MAG: hypothetical protein ACOZQL_07200 [Myxococcota bacterium]
MTRIAVGHYQARLGGFTMDAGNVHVTAYGSGPERCSVAFWDIDLVEVRCFDATGTPVDAQWTLRYTDQHVANAAHAGAYAWLSNVAPASIDAQFQWSSTGATLTATRLAPGRYMVLIPMLAGVGKTSAMVTAYATLDTRCAVVGWSTVGSDTTVEVQCRDSSGALADSRFAMSYLTTFE